MDTTRHDIHTCDTGIQLDTIIHQCDTGIQLDTIIHPCDTGIQLDTSIHTCDTGIQLDTIIHPCDTGIQLDTSIHTCEHATYTYLNKHMYTHTIALAPYHTQNTNAQTTESNIMHASSQCLQNMMYSNEHIYR